MSEDTDLLRVKFYGTNDLGTRFLASSAFELIREFACGRKIGGINDALELFNALEFERHSMLGAECSAEALVSVKKEVKALNDAIAQFFRGIDASNLKDHASQVDCEFRDDFLTLLMRFNVGATMDKPLFIDALLEAGIGTTALISNRKIVDKFDHALRAVLQSNPLNAEILIRMCLVQGDDPGYFLPKSLTNDEACLLLGAYLESERPHLNYVQVVAEAKNGGRLGITDKLRLNARKRHDKLASELFESGAGGFVKSGYGVRIDPDQEAPALDTIEPSATGTDYVRVLGGKYLLDHLDPISVLNNFGHVIGYWDAIGLKLPAFKSELSALRQLFISGKQAYPRGSEFTRKDVITEYGTDAYHSLLMRAGVEIEEVLVWFFEVFLADEFDARNFRFSASNAAASWLERSRHLASEMEGVAKQFTLFCNEGELDRELFEMSSASTTWNSLPSLHPRKFALPDAEGKCEELMLLLFDDQMGLTYINAEVNAGCFFDLVQKYDVCFSDLQPHQAQKLEPLFVGGVLDAEEGILRLQNSGRITILAHLYAREAAPFYKYPEGLVEASERLHQVGMVEFSSQLLSPAEASYFNFWLNKSEFSDGPDLRNIYAHGTNPDPAQADQHRANYMRLLRLTISLAFRVWDEFESLGSRERRVATTG